MIHLLFFYAIMQGKLLKTECIVLCLVLILSLVGCKKTGMSKVKFDYGTSSVYTEEDMNAAIEVIKNEFSTFEGCELQTDA